MADLGDSDLRPDARDALAEALWNPLTSRVLTALTERPDVTIREIAERLNESPRRVRHQVGSLVDAGLATVTAEVRRRGVIERRYATRVELSFPGDDDIDPDLRIQLSKEVVRLLLSDIGRAADAGTFASKRDRFECRFYGEVDDQCIEELAEIHARAYREIEESIKAGCDRSRRSKEPGTEIVSALFLLDAPLWNRDSNAD